MADWAEEQRLKQPAQVFQDDTVLLGPPSLTAEDFKTPRLRRCKFDLATISWEARLGGGLDGYVWKVKFGEEGPFTLKLYWDAKPPADHPYYAPRRECQNAALLQMMEAAVEQAAGESPITVDLDAKTKADVLANVLAFSNEGRREQQRQCAQRPKPISSIPRMKKCYGWLTVDSNLFRSVSWELRPPVVYSGRVKRSMSYDQEYIAIVSEFIEEGENDPEVVQKVLEFFWEVGFAHTLSPAARNWKSGVLTDLGDIIQPGDYDWKEQRHRPVKAHSVLRE
ncbi:hypothetical protein CONLIGDRAFT_654182 [Coniochaeta ligniaria NRRL 30616]|uniref:Uncharacterized protein n=1 Tax=Coniochaeta ligniaria NRRL 30616 TaxID=1408157 RepID=A0A1J7JPK8_9PEZI|nr:hypothetical protein CONLIGDRAFT_654182 [Coniochaeta ligniaria NRRL 30616]